jgi:DMSO/TMAO reductase YedYZ molybdopterin-dependent catalytic subunit
MKMSFWGKRFISSVLLFSLTWILGLWSVDNGWTQNKSGEVVGTNAHAEESLDLLGDLPHPHRMDASALHQLPRVEVRTTDPHDPGKEIVYAGIPLMEMLKVGGLQLDSGMEGIRETVAMTVVVGGSDGYRAAFALAELEPELTDRVILLAYIKDGQPLPPREGPFRIIVPGEKRPARWVRQVSAVTVHRN